jgi:hypothetical protein
MSGSVCWGRLVGGMEWTGWWSMGVRGGLVVVLLGVVVVMSVVVMCGVGCRFTGVIGVCRCSDGDHD